MLFPKFRLLLKVLDSSKSFKGSDPFRGINPASGAVIYYQLPEADAGGELSLEIRDESGYLVRKITSKRDSLFKSYPGGPSPEATLNKGQGLQRFVWDLRYPSMKGATNVYIEGSYAGHKVGPGKYSLTLKYDGKEENVELEVKNHPNYENTLEDYKAYHEIMQHMESSLSEMHQMVNQLFTAKEQIQQILPRLNNNKQFKSVASEAKSLVEKIKEWDEEMVQRKTKAYDDVENFPNKFTANYLFLINQTQSDIPRVNKANQDRLKELDSKWANLKASGQAILQDDLPAFNRALWQIGMGAIWTTNTIKP